ncbi:helix-turn-helix transcriptional regulator [Candidatus Poribacteria bacterium]|jgi:transcriptional regulator with XRE-family HTH domain|nr:helix-turn-helix transcriptional regulator [Candidatus Poribacteria bacterium]
MDPKIVFGRNMRRIRKAQRMTQQRLAEVARLHTSYIGGVERGERNIAITNMTKIAIALNTPLAELVDGIPAVALREVASAPTPGPTAGR